MTHHKEEERIVVYLNIMYKFVVVKGMSFDLFESQNCDVLYDIAQKDGGSQMLDDAGPDYEPTPEQQKDIAQNIYNEFADEGII